MTCVAYKLSTSNTSSFDFKSRHGSLSCVTISYSRIHKDDNSPEVKMTRGRAVGVASPVSARGLDLVLPSAAVGGGDMTV